MGCLPSRRKSRGVGGEKMKGDGIGLQIGDDLEKKFDLEKVDDLDFEIGDDLDLEIRDNFDLEIRDDLHLDLEIQGYGLGIQGRDLRARNNVFPLLDLLSEGEHLLGDGAYTLTNKLLIPYVNDGQLTPIQRTHNNLLSACRAKVENSFARLRSKNRRLKHLPMRNMELVTDHIMASFVVHNFIILEGDHAEGIPPVIRPHLCEEEFQRRKGEAQAMGVLKREYIAHTIFQ